MFFALPTDVHFAGSFKLTCLKDPTGSASWVMWQGTRGPLCIAVRSVEIPKRPVVASEGSEGRGTSHVVSSSSSFEATDVVLLGCNGLSFWARPEGEGSNQPFLLEKGASEEGAHSPASGLQQTWGPLTSSQVFPPCPTPAPWVPLTSDGLHIF